MEAALTRRITFLPFLLGAPALFVAASFTFADELPAKEAVLLARLSARIDAIEARLDGVLGVYVRDLKTGHTIELRADEVFPTASSIKLAVLYELYRQAAEGGMIMGELTRPPLPRVKGGGVLQELGDRVTLSWRDLAVLMMGWSDNEATNLLIRRVGMDAVNRRLDALSLGRTRLRRQMMDLEAARRGDENVSTPREIARLAEVVATGEGVARAAADDLLLVATIRDEGSFFRRGLPEEQRAVSKPGALEGVRCEAAWVDLPGRRYVAAVMTGYLQHEKDGEAAIAEISAAVYQTFDRLARASEHGRVISPK